MSKPEETLLIVRSRDTLAGRGATLSRLRWQQIQPDSPECAVQLAELPSSSSAAHALKPETGLASMDDWVSGR